MKINLADYDFQQDIQNRILMSQFTALDVAVLDEILLSSLTIHLSNLASDLDRDIIEVMEVVDRLSQTGLCKRIGEQISVDKDVRKYYESQILKFEEDFEPNVDYIQSFLKKVPIHVLPIWYAIPRSSTNIFESIVDKYLRTPRLFQRYLLEPNFEDPILKGIMEDVFTTPDFEIRSRKLRDKYKLSRQEFQERMLQLEFHFICCVSYRQIDDEWKEVITPFYEWRQYLRFLRDSKTTPLETPPKELRSEELAFAKDFQEALRTSKLPPEPEYANWLSKKLAIAQESPKEWLELSLEDLALSLYRHPNNLIDSFETYCTEKNFRELEKALSSLLPDRWFSFDDFLPSVTAALHTTEEVSLQKKGRHWAYVLPTYTDEDKAFIRAAIFERFFETGFVSIGDNAFRITQFGQNILSRP